MAVIWEREINGNYYEVRTAGASIRLYRNGVNHSQWNPNRPLNGMIWDLITLPALYRPKNSIQQAAILGFGAGTVGKQLLELVKPERVVGIELDPIHLSIADGFFECTEGCELIAGDAVEWVQTSTEKGVYDLIVDDLYAENDGIPVRCVPMDTAWCQSLASMLAPGGILIFNLVEPEKIPYLPVLKDPKLKKRFPETQMHQIEGYENRIIACSDQAFSTEDFEANLKDIYRLYPASRGAHKRYIHGKP